jgi:transmembrane sensor
MKRSTSEEELKKFLDGQASEFAISGESEALSDVFKDKQFLSEAYRIWQETECSNEYRERLMPVLDKLHQRIKQEAHSGNIWRKRRELFYAYLSKAAIILLIPMLALTILKWDQLFSGDSHTLARAELHSPFGSRTEFFLPDGSSGWLNGGSSISFPLVFNGNTREVFLHGEAYFDVLTNSDQPFVVNTENASVRARGTAFVVCDFDNDSETEVTLIEGSVDVFKRNNSGKMRIAAEMTHGTHFSMNHLDGSTELKQVDVSQYTSWIQGKLVFRNDPMLTVTRRLERWYNVDIEIKDQELLTHTYYATFKDESLEEVMRLISLTTPIKYEIIYQKSDENREYSRKRVIISSN